MGTSVESGTATGVVVTTGVNTYLGSMAGSITGDSPPTSFDHGLSRFTWLMIRLTAVMVPLVFLINGFTKHDWKSAFFFALAVAVGLTPEMLPMIVSVCLSEDALAMSRKKVIVKRLNSIQNFGGMDILCSDKTGTLTEDRVVLQRHFNMAGLETEEVLLHGYLISYFQTGLKNLLDRAIPESADFHGQADVAKYKKLDEIPFDFTRRMMSVLVQDPEGKAILLTKGAPEEVFHQCLAFRAGWDVVADGPQVDRRVKRRVRQPRSPRILSSTSGWGPAPISATCSACWEQALSCPIFRWLQSRC
jgi:P-type Mg2+ transporter